MLKRKRVVFIANSLENAYQFQQVLSDIDADVFAGSTLQMETLLQPQTAVDLIVFEATGLAYARLDEVVSLAKTHSAPLLVIVDEADLAFFRIPDVERCDFLITGASRAECSARTRRLLGERGLGDEAEILSVDGMVVNYDTYQVSIDGEPIDLTYLEYALLAFFVKHPERTYSREALLSSVWGVDYYGGSRTVDVHVRRIRAKIGPALAQHLETIRGVGYLWRKS